MDALAKLHHIVSRAFKINPKIKFEVFIHKVDGLSDDNKIETQRDIHQRATDDLVDAGLDNLHLRYFRDGERQSTFTGPNLFVVVLCPLWNCKYFYWTDTSLTSLGIRTGVFCIDFLFIC